MENLINRALNYILTFINTFLNNPPLAALDLLKITVNIIVSIIIVWFVVYLVIYLVGYVIDRTTDYDEMKILNKLQKRTEAKSVGGGEEYFLRYWVWQRKKREIIIHILRSIATDRGYYPKAVWRKTGRVKLWFRRECWINGNTYSEEKYEDYARKINH